MTELAENTALDGARRRRLYLFRHGAVDYLDAQGNWVADPDAVRLNSKGEEQARRMALVNKGIALRRLDRAEEAIEVYGSVVERFAKNTEPALLERVGWALIGKAESLDQLDQFGDAETVFRQAIGLDIRGLEAEIWNRLGNLLLDRKGDWNSALATYEAGLAAIKASDRKAFLHAQYRAMHV